MDKNYVIINKEEVKGDIFIIPDRVWKISEYDIESFRNEFTLISNLNNVSEEDPLMVHVWITSEGDFSSDDLDCHGFVYNDEPYKAYCSNFPDELFKNKREGDCVELLIPVKPRNFDTEQQLVLQIKVRLNQSEYRYRAFGKFEEVLNYILAL